MAKNFAINDLPADKCPVIYHIKFTGSEGLFYLSDRNFSEFAEYEREVLIQDGLSYLVTKKEQLTRDGNLVC